MKTVILSALVSVVVVGLLLFVVGGGKDGPKQNHERILVSSESGKVYYMDGAFSIGESRDVGPMTITRREGGAFFVVEKGLRRQCYSEILRYEHRKTLVVLIPSIVGDEFVTDQARQKARDNFERYLDTSELWPIEGG